MIDDPQSHEQPRSGNEEIALQDETVADLDTAGEMAGGLRGDGGGGGPNTLATCPEHTCPDWHTWEYCEPVKVSRACR